MPPECKVCPEPERVARLEIHVETMRHDLFGNGNPGVLARIEERLEKMEDRLGKVIVAIALLSGACGAAGTKIAGFILGG